jgi:hypothetical protein
LLDCIARIAQSNNKIEVVISAIDKGLKLKSIEVKNKTPIKEN